MAYPHDRNDCTSCEEFDSDMTVDLLRDEVTQAPGEAVGRWCSRCAGPLLARLALLGRTALVRPLDAEPMRHEVQEDVVQRRHEAVADPVNWTIDFAVDVLKDSTEAGVRLVRALVAEGGSATVDRLREVAGQSRLSSMAQTVNMAARRQWRERSREGASLVTVAQSRPAPGRPEGSKTHAYDLLPAGMLSIWSDALAQLGH
ncbi:hypothetical protein ACVDFE_00220 [Lentzea chajnantorensis]